MPSRGRALESRQFVGRHHLDHHRLGRRRVQSVGADKEQPDDQGRQMTANRNDKTRANVSLQSDHIGCKSLSPPANRPTDTSAFFWRRISPSRALWNVRRPSVWRVSRGSLEQATFFECTLERLLECLFKILHIVNRPHLLRHGKKRVRSMLSGGVIGSRPPLTTISGHLMLSSALEGMKEGDQVTLWVEEKPQTQMAIDSLPLTKSTESSSLRKSN